MERKPRPRRQAQVEEFAHARVREFSDEQKLFLQYSDELSRNVIQSPEDIPEEYPDELKRAIQNYWGAYVRFLRGLKVEDRQALKLAERNADYYEQTFSGPVKRLKSRLKQEGERSNGYIGKGSNGAAYALEVGGVEYVVKFGGSATQANFEVRALVRAKGIPRVAQIVAYSFEDRAQVMERLPGKDVTQLDPAIVSKATDQQMVDLVRTVQQLAARGVVIDPKPSNFLYDRKAGFSVLDYHTAHAGSSKVAEQVMSVRHALTWQPNTFKYPEHDDPEADKKIKQNSIQRQREYLPRLIRFVTVLEEQFPDIIFNWRMHRRRIKQEAKQHGGEFLRKDDLVMSDSRVLSSVQLLEEHAPWVFE